MAFNFPVSLTSFFNTLKIESMTLDVMNFVDVQGTEYGLVLINEIAFPKWVADVTVGPMPMETARIVRSQIRRIAPHGTFYVTDPERRYPASDPTGSGLSGASPEVHDIEGRTIRLSGLPEGYTLNWGDLGAIDYGSGKYIFEVADAAIVANSSGITPFFEVNPPIFEEVNIGDVVDLHQPQIPMKFISRNIGETMGIITHGFSFRAMQVFE